MSGFIYLFRQTNTDFYKIGMTQTESVNNRFIAFKTYSPHPVEIVSVIETENPIALEKKIHNIFSEKRLNGEFFRLNEDDVLKIKGFETEKQKEIESFFWQYIIGKNLDLNKIRNLINNLESKENKNENNLERDNRVIDILIKEKTGQKMSSTEVFEYLKTVGIYFESVKSLGVVLKQNFNQKIMQSNGKVKRVYLL